MIDLLPRRQWKISVVGYKSRVCTPSSSPLSATIYVATSHHCRNHFHTLPRQCLAGSVLEAAKPAYSCMSLSLYDPCSLVFEPRSNPRSQAGASLVWGHEKFEFDNDQGFQWRAWFNECGRAFKIKAAWGHPDIVRGARTRLPSSNRPNIY